MKLTKKQKQFLSHLFGGNCGNTLACMDSFYCEGEADNFKDSYGVSFKFAEKAVTALQIELSK